MGNSRILDPRVVGDVHYNTAQDVQKTLQNYKNLADIIAILGMDELDEEDKLTVSRARKLSKSFEVAEVFTGSPGRYVEVDDTCVAFQAVLDGKHDDLPEGAFYMVGGIDEVQSKAIKLSEMA